MKTFLSILLSMLLYSSIHSQCVSSIDSVYYKNMVLKRPSVINVCKGDDISIYIHYSCDSIFFFDDFNTGVLSSNWANNCLPMFNNPCGPGLDGTTYLWVGPATSFPRRLTTIAYSVTTQSQICFDMKYASQSNSSPCEGPDESTEGVHLQYSTISANGPWTDIAYWDPNGGYDPVLTSWQNYTENIPITGNVWISWYQDVTSGNDYDHWGLDNVKIISHFFNTANITSFLYLDNQIVAQNTQSYNFIPDHSCDLILVSFSNNSSSSDTLHINVYDPTLSIQNLNSTYFLNSPPVTLIGFPAPGNFSGTGVVNGSVFNPATAGPGIHTITYHHFYISENQSLSDNIQGNFLFFDDFSIDMGWTGYGTQWTRGSATTSVGCSGSQDPAQDHTTTSDNFIIGNWLGGCYQNSMNQTYWLTSPIINCSQADSVRIKFYSHSGVEGPTYDHLYVEAYNGTTWQQIWTNNSSYNETSWNYRDFFAPQAAHNPNFRVRFGIGPTDESVTYKGWNIDDFGIWANTENYIIYQNLCEFNIDQQVTVLNQMSIDNEPLSNELFPAQVSIFTADGRTLFIKLINSKEELYQSLQPYTEGLYFYKIQAKNLQIGKLIFTK